MKKTKYLILGAGPAGICLAASLKDRGEDDFLIVEKEAEPGGLCRSRDVDGFGFDIGGGHFLDTRKAEVDRFLFRFLPEEEWESFERDSRISILGKEIGSPIEANIWQLDIEDQISYIKAIAEAGCVKGTPKPELFTDWIYWKLGGRIAEDYMLPYNRKMFGDDLDVLGTYWLEKLPEVSFEDTLRSCLTGKAVAKQPGHAHFLYPKDYGYGEVWKRLGNSLGDRLILSENIEALDVDNRVVNGKYQGELIINTVPWPAIKEIEGADGEIVSAIRSLKHTAIVTEYHPEKLETAAQWVYYPDPDLAYHRILVRHNFCRGRGYWTETRAERYEGAAAGPAFMNEYAYPLNTIDKPAQIEKILKFMEKKGIYGLGRWGEWQHYNSDVVVERAMGMAQNLAGAIT